MNIPFVDVGAQHKEIRKELNAAIKRVLKKSDFILGQDVTLFEREFARFSQARYAVGVASGTDALYLALLSLGIAQGDEVIVPAFTYIATALAVSYTGAKPVFVDIDEKTYNIDVAQVSKAITGRTKAIIPVHLYGQPADMNALCPLAKKYKLAIIEDSAQAHGATVSFQNGKSAVVGSIGDAGCFSFYPSKNLGALGDGGMVVTNDERINAKLLMLRDYGRVSKYEHVMIGYNCRLDTLQAAMLRVKLQHLADWNARRQAAAGKYTQALKGLEGIILPQVAAGVSHVYHVYAIRSNRRDSLLEIFKRRGISVVVHYPIPLHLQKAYAQLGYKAGDFPVAERVAGEIVSLPMYPHIKDSQIDFVTRTIKQFAKG